MSKRKKGSWIVRCRKVIDVELVVENCTEEQAKEDPYSFIVPDESGERELLCIEIDVQSVEPNE